VISGSRMSIDVRSEYVTISPSLCTVDTLSNVHARIQLPTYKGVIITVFGVPLGHCAHVFRSVRGGNVRLPFCAPVTYRCRICDGPISGLRNLITHL
jgi:hypothetical protein